MSSRRRTRSSSCSSRGNDKRRQSMICADQSRNLSDNPSANPLSRPLTQEDIPNIVQQVLPDIVQQILATLQPPESAHVRQQMDTGTRSSTPQQSANTIESNTTSSGATDSSRTTDRTSVVSNLPLSEQRTPNTSGGTTADNSGPPYSASTTPPNDPAPTLPKLADTHDFTFLEDGEDTLTDVPEHTWLSQWYVITSSSPIYPRVPAIACRVSTPLSLSGWRIMLQGHPNRDLVHLFLIGITQGFKIGYNYITATRKPAKRNLPGATSHPEVVDEYLQTEVSLGRVVGLFPLDALPAAHISRFGVIPKGHQQDKW